MMNSSFAFIRRCFLGGSAFMLGILVTGLAAVTVSGTFNTFSKGELISASSINTNFTALKTALEGVNDAPVGTILPWHKSFTNTPALPDGWVECDGTVVSDTASVYNGQTLPDLNSTGRFLRGSTTSGSLQAATQHLHDHARGDLTMIFMTNSAAHTIPQNVDSYEGATPPGAANSWIGVGGSVQGGTSERQYYTSRPINMTIVWIMKIK